MVRPVVVTGTDTGVGKTWVSCALIRALKQHDVTVRAIKPIETGCQDAHEEDGVALARAAGQKSPTKALRRFAAPLAPPAAATLERHHIHFPGLIDELRGYIATADVILIEGAGGLLSPLTWSHTIVDLAKALDAQVVVVSDNRLGILNQLRLTLAQIRSHQLPMLTPVINQARDPKAQDDDNSIRRNPGDCLRLSDVGEVLFMPYNLEPSASAACCALLVEQILGARR